MKFIKYVFVFILAFGCSDSDEVNDENKKLSAQEIEDLQFMKEEEKLARDVYLYSYDLYGQKIFKNISNSEQSHMNSVTVILEKYSVQDLSLEARGEFSNMILQGLYDDLISLALKSLEDALIVGATIEDLDINDLNNVILNTSHEDIESMYELLNCGSRNHIRSFTNNLENLGGSYAPQFISLDDYNSIVNSMNEKCNN